MSSEPESKEPGKDQRLVRRIPTGEERERVLRAIKRALATGEVPWSQTSADEIHKKWLLAVPKQKVGRKPIKPRFDC